MYVTRFGSRLSLKNRWINLICSMFGVALAAAVSAQEISEISILQGESFRQTSAAAPAADGATPFVFRSAALSSSKSMVTAGPTIQAPGGTAHKMTTTTASTDLYFRFEDPQATSATLATAYPSGTYTLAYTGQFSGAHNLPISFPAAAIPTAPQLSNFTAAQSIDPTASFDLQWPAIPGATAADLMEVKVTDSLGNVVASSPQPDLASDALPGTSTSFTIDADTLIAGQTYTATITFYKVTGHVLTALPLSFTAYFAETKVSIAAAGATTVDTTPPTLLTAQPPDNFLLPVANFYNFPASFEFSETMNGSESIQWSSNIDPAKVQYQWVPDNGSPNGALLATYQGGWPAGAHITWVLNPVANAANNFRDAAGNELAANTYHGGFLTSPGISGSICEGSDPVLGAGFGIVKAIHNYQNSAGAIVADTNGPATLTAFYKPPTQTDLTLTTLQIAAIHKLDSLTPPDNATNFVRSFVDVRNTLADLDAAYPAGEYDMQQRNTQVQVTGTAALNVAAATYPPTPHFQNLPIAAGTDLTADFTVRWDAFADEANGGLTVLEVLDSGSNLVYRLPDACMGRTLAPGSSSAVIPKGTFQPDTDYSIVLSFYKFSDQGKTLSGIAGRGFAALSESTLVSLTPKNDVVATPPPNLHKFVGAAVSNGQLQLQFSAWSGSNYVLEATSDLRPPTRWTIVQITQAPTQNLQIADPQWQQFANRYYRIRMIDGALPSLQTNGIAVIDTARSVMQTVTEDGGDLTLTSVAGDVYTLHIDPFSMFGVEDLTMTLVNDVKPLPLSGGFAGGVQFDPPDLPLIANATLTVQFASAPADSLAAATYHLADGTFFLKPISRQSNTVTVPLDQLGGVALAAFNPADLNYFKTNARSAFPESILQDIAIARAQGQLTANSPATKKASASGAAQSPSQAQLLLQAMFDSRVYPQLDAVQSGTGDSDAIVAALNGFIIWSREASAAAVPALASDLDQGNALARATINNRAVSMIDAALNHDIDAIMRLSHLRNVINLPPWGPTWVPGDGQTLMDKINKLLHMTIQLDSNVHWDTAVGPVTSIVRGTVDYMPDNQVGTIKGAGQVVFLDHEHYQPAPCSVVPSLSPGVFNSFQIAAYCKRPAHPGDRYQLVNWYLSYWPGDVKENDNVICPYGSSGPILEYWFPSFGYLHEKELGAVKLKGAPPRAAYLASKGWTVSQSGNPDLGTRDYNNSGEFQDATVTETTTLVIKHTPQQ